MGEFSFEVPDSGRYHYRQYRPGKWQVYFSHQGKQVYLQKSVEGIPLRSENDCENLTTILEIYGYDPKSWGKDKTFQFDYASLKWVNETPASTKWRNEKKRMMEKVLIPFFGKTDIRDITSQMIDSLHKTMEDKGNSTKYIKSVLAELKACLRWYRKSLKEMPEFKPIRIQDKEIKWLTYDQQEKVFEFIPEKYKRIFTFLRTYGTRLNEACGLQKDDLKFERGYLTIQNIFDDGGRLVPFTKTKTLKVLPIIQELTDLFKADSDSPFVFSREGKPYTPKSLNRIWKRASKKANKKYKTPVLNPYNSLRHSWATQRLNEGFSLDEISHVLGHTTTTMSKRYAKYETKKLAGVIRGRSVHGLFMGPDTKKPIKNQDNMVGGTGIEPVTSGL